MEPAQEMTGDPSEQALEAATTRLHSLRQMIAGLVAQEEQIQTQQERWRSQAMRLTMQAEQAEDAANIELASQLRAQCQLSQKQVSQLDQQLIELAQQKQTLARQQVQMLVQIEQMSAHLGKRPPSLSTRSASPPSTHHMSSAFWKLSKRRLIVSGLAFLAVLLVLLPVLSGLISRLTAHTTALGTLPPDPNAPFYHPAGTAPTSEQCLNTLSYFCFSPEQLQQAYQITPLYKRGYNGQGQTIVLLGVGYTTTLQEDLHQFDHAWGLPDPHLTILEPHGPPVPYTCPQGRDVLQAENTLDVEMAHAIAPGATLVLLIGSNDSQISEQLNCRHYSLLADVTYALDQHLGQIISISYGQSELGTRLETDTQRATVQQDLQEADTVFQRAATAGVTVIASSGDDGATTSNDPTTASSYWNQPTVSWPASDPYVLAVGGTSLNLEQTTGIATDEVAWNRQTFGLLGASGGGMSALFPEPAYQKLVHDQTLLQGRRGVPDVAFTADNLITYGSYTSGPLGIQHPQWKQWQLVGGTSAGAPCWAGLLAIANQLLGKPVGFLQPLLYQLQGQGLRDITFGSNTFGGVTGYEALPGYDLVSGWGTPLADQFLAALAQHASQG